MSASAERRRERARAAQRRSRAHRKANLESLQNQVKVLERSLEQMTQICLGFSDIVISAVGAQNYDFLHRSAEPFMREILHIVAHVLDDGDSNDDIAESVKLPTTVNMPWVTSDTGKGSCEATALETDSPPKSPSAPASQVLRIVYNKELGAETNMPNGWPPHPPNLTYGILPAVSPLYVGENVAPLDIVAYLNEDIEMPFANALFWNTMTLAYSTISNPHSPLVRELFHYVGQLEAADVLESRIHRRLSFRPRRISSYMVADIQAQDVWRPDGDDTVLADPIRAGGVFFEAEVMDKINGRIMENMKAEQDDRSYYLDAAGVQERLASRWKLSCVESPTPNLSNPLHTCEAHATTHNFWFEWVIWHLARSSRCLGNSIGFPIKTVDNLATQLRGLNISM